PRPGGGPPWASTATAPTSIATTRRPTALPIDSFPRDEDVLEGAPHPRSCGLPARLRPRGTTSPRDRTRSVAGIRDRHRDRPVVRAGLLRHRGAHGPADEHVQTATGEGGGV